MKKLTSSLPLLQPTAIFDTKTGLQITVEQHLINVNQLLDYCYTEAKHVHGQHETRLETILVNRNKISAPAEYGRQNGLRTRKNLPRTVKAQSRIEKLVQHKVISETASYINNPNPRKQLFNFNHTINLGSIDKQMASLSVSGNELSLLWKCWDTEYLLTFTIPDYVLSRDIVKFSLPVVSGKGYWFSIQEAVPERSGRLTAGLDMGRVEPYTIAVVNPTGARVASYTTSGRLSQLNKKRERLLVEKKHILTKAKHYEKLGLNPEILWVEYGHKRNKITTLGKVVSQQVGSEITKKLIKHNLNILNVENLSWVTGVKYGSRWNHSIQQQAIAHSLLRKGIQVKKVNPKNTSQSCHGCGETIKHDTKNRTVRCDNCRTVLDRDFNAAMNIAKRTKRYPVLQRQNGDNFSGLPQVVEKITHNSYIRNKILLEKQEKQPK